MYHTPLSQLYGQNHKGGWKTSPPQSILDKNKVKEFQVVLTVSSFVVNLVYRVTYKRWDCKGDLKFRVYFDSKNILSFPWIKSFYGLFYDWVKKITSLQLQVKIGYNYRYKATDSVNLLHSSHNSYPLWATLYAKIGYESFSKTFYQKLLISNFFANFINRRKKEDNYFMIFWLLLQW